MSIKIPIYKPFLKGNEKKYVNECLDSTWISSKGKFIQIFEESFANFLGVKYCSTVCNGTLALHLALLSLGISEDDEVIVPTLTYIASVNSIVYTGAKPIFVDSLEDTWQINPEEIRKKITKKTKAIMVVHLYGHPCEMDSIIKIAKENNIFVIEDCAEAIASKYKDKYVGTFGDISAFSFFGNKTITTGEGGMIATNDKTLYDRAVHFKGQGLAKYREYWHDVIGYNYRMTNICAAIGLAQLEQIDKIVYKKRQIAEWYKELLKPTKYIFHAELENVYHSYWMCSILVDDYKKRDELRKHLLKNGVETRPVFYPVHTMPMYSKKFERHIVAENISYRGINLPSYPDLTYDEVKYICDIILNFENNKKSTEPL
ncbi:MAG: GDP-perosamine synthase [Candidatus Sericytochromatia bacterium]|nr:MAG: GDP-perosamine synthase [Candidatus Sericytochromatia bacterium]